MIVAKIDKDNNLIKFPYITGDFNEEMGTNYIENIGNLVNRYNQSNKDYKLVFVDIDPPPVVGVGKRIQQKELPEYNGSHWSIGYDIIDDPNRLGTHYTEKSEVMNTDGTSQKRNAFLVNTTEGKLLFDRLPESIRKYGDTSSLIYEDTNSPLGSVITIYYGGQVAQENTNLVYTGDDLHVAFKYEINTQKIYKKEACRVPDINFFFKQNNLYEKFMLSRFDIDVLFADLLEGKDQEEEYAVGLTYDDVTVLKYVDVYFLENDQDDTWYQSYCVKRGIDYTPPSDPITGYGVTINARNNDITRVKRYTANLQFT